MPKKKKPVLEDPESDLSDDDIEFPFVKVSRPEIGTTWDVIRRIGPAIIGGDFSGNPRGNAAMDIQISRANPEDVASGNDSIIFGSYARASADRSLALGSYAATDIPDTCNLSGLQILKAHGANALTNICERGAAEIILATDLINLALVAQYNLYMPWSIGHSCTFFVNECILVASKLPAVLGGTCAVSFGTPADPDLLVPETYCNHINDLQTYEHFAVTGNSGYQALSASVTHAADILPGAEIKGRFIFKGLLIEDEP